VKPLFGRTFFDLYDTLVSSYMMPLGGLCVSLYAGWFWRGEGEANELAGPAGRPWLFPVWRFLVRFVAPAAVLVIFLNQAGIFW
jgi:NSS family neurotransmitter:Na+ symporter